MGLSAAEKILKKHLREGQLSPGGEIGITIDQTLTQDATGTMVYLQFEAMEIPRVKTELSVSYVDHNTLQTDFRNMDDHRFLQSIARKKGLFFSRPGNGICHQVHLERFGAPGKTLLGSDSHTPTGGGLGMIAIGAGGLDVAVAMAGAPFYLPAPEIVEVRLSGKLPRMCSAKDVILTLLQKETVKGGVGKIYEYTGEGVKSLGIPERATITNMGAELGATTSLFPSDEVTRAFLESQGRGDVWQEVAADDDAAYSRTIEIDLTQLEPMAAQPHMPDEVVPVRELAGKRVDQVAIGSCTNSSINDLGVAADILADRVIAENVSLGIAPGSRQVVQSAMKAGILSKLTAAGARILESACGPCIGMGFAPGSGGVSLRTFNRNFKGRSGTADAGIYLVSPETAAAAALTGEFADPREVFAGEKKDYSAFLTVDDGMIIPPVSEKEGETTEVLRGPNIKPCPTAAPLADTLEAPVILKTGDNITTDDIMPAGARILPLRSNIPAIAEHVFETVDADFPRRAREAQKSFVVGGENYGQGSSREHAALAPMYLGVKAVITKSFARIHRGNLINFGILPLTFADPADYERIGRGDILSISGVDQGLAQGRTEYTCRNLTKSESYTLTCDLAPRAAAVVRAGGRLNHTRQQVKG